MKSTGCGGGGGGKKELEFGFWDFVSDGLAEGIVMMLEI